VEIDGDGHAVRTIPTPGQVTGLTIVEGRFYAVTTPDTKSREYRLIRIDARSGAVETVELAVIPFVARSLSFDGARFWTHMRDEKVIVAFAKVD
jgi:hypothetical protein